MLFSVSTGKSRSGWLDRLRISKGFAENDAVDLDNCVQIPNSSLPGTADPNRDTERILEPTGNDDKQLCNVMSNVLNELFNFGDNCSNPTNFIKSARKQANPRICAFSRIVSNENSNAALEKAGGSRSGDNNSKAGGSRSGDNNSGVAGVKVLGKREDDGEGNGKDMNLLGFSRTEVTVIDTSYESWKFEKLLYRKKNVWKVRDKKGKSAIVGSTKKRKMNGSVENQRDEKKQKVDEKQEDCHLQLNAASPHKDLLEAHEKASERTCKTLKKNRTDFLLIREMESSSVILIKSIPASKKPGTSISKGVPKSKQSTKS